MGLRSLRERSAVERFGGLIGSIGRIDIVRNTEVRLAWTLVAGNALEFRFDAIDLSTCEFVSLGSQRLDFFFSSAKQLAKKKAYVDRKFVEMTNFYFYCILLTHEVKSFQVTYHSNLIVLLNNGKKVS